MNEAAEEVDMADRRYAETDGRDDAAVEAAWADVHRANETLRVALDQLTELVPPLDLPNGEWGSRMEDMLHEAQAKVLGRHAPADLIELAVSVLGGERQALEWWGKSATELDGGRPIELICTDPGMKLVRDFLEHLERGL